MKTNIQKIRDIVKTLYLAVKPEIGDFGIVVHPIIPNQVIPKRYNGETIWLDIEKDYDEIKNIYFDIIDNSDLWRLMILIDKPWKLTFFKYVNQYLSPKDYAEILKSCWTEEENPNQDCNVSTREAVKFFKKAKKNLIMDEDELEHYNQFENEVIVYRGVTEGHERLGLSWTDNKEKAEWFRDRFEHLGRGGYLLQAKIKKKDILCYLNCRDEQEVVVDIGKLKNVKEMGFYE
jgi:hypothetical protein